MVGYSLPTMSGGQLRDGAVCVWSIRSVRWPAWSFRTACGVSAVAVAGKGGGGFLAVGLEDGGLQLREVGQQQVSHGCRSSLEIFRCRICLQSFIYGSNPLGTLLSLHRVAHGVDNPTLKVLLHSEKSPETSRRCSHSVIKWTYQSMLLSPIRSASPRLGGRAWKGGRVKGFCSGQLEEQDHQGPCFQEEAAYQCMSGPQKHRGPIWQMAWVEEGQRKAEALVTVAGDGRVCQWRISKVHYRHFCFHCGKVIHTLGFKSSPKFKTTSFYVLLRYCSYILLFNYWLLLERSRGFCHCRVWKPTLW